MNADRTQLLPNLQTHQVIAKIALPIDVSMLAPLLEAFGKEAVVITEGPLTESGWLIVALPLKGASR